MFTLTQARRAINNTAFFARGRAYAEEGRVRNLRVDTDGSRLECSATVRGHGEYYSVSFVYDQETETFPSCECDCPAYARAEFGCKHVAAAMIALCRGEQQSMSAGPTAASRREESGSLRARLEQYRRMKEEREQALEQRRLQEERERRERIRREEEERLRLKEEQRRRFVDGLVAGGMRRSAPGQEPVRLFPTLRFSEDEVQLELRIGRRRAYVVRNFDEFAQRMRDGQAAVYGKELTFSHKETDVEERDRALLWYIVALSESMETRVGRLLLQGTNLDQTMRLLCGREVDCEFGGQSRRMAVEAGEGTLRVALREQDGRTLLCVGAERVFTGAAGAYFLLPEEGKLLCAWGERFDGLRGLLAVRAEYPDGLPLEGEQLDAVCTRLLLPVAGRIDLAEGAALLAEHTPMALAVRFRIDMDDEGRLTCRTEFDYGGRVLLPESEDREIRRDRYAEQEAMEAARARFPISLPTGEQAFEGDDEEVYALLTQELTALCAWGEVFVAERLARMNVQRPRTMTFGLSAAGEALILKADLGGFTQEELQSAYTAYRQKRRFVRLEDGTFLSGEALSQAAEAAQLLDGLDTTAEQAQAGADLPASRAMYLEEALKDREEMKLSAPGELRSWMDRLKTAQTARAQQPAGLACTLRGYQQEGLSWLCALSGEGFGGILADDMGLGKTVQALALLLCEKERGETLRALVVCPASLQLNWLSEARRFAPELTVCALMGGAAERKALIGAEEPAELMIASYDQVRRDAALYESIELSHVLLDEAQYIKNAASQAAKAVKTLRARHRFAMTGTPVENRLSELWSIFDFLMPGYLQSYKKFKERFEGPIVRDGDEEARRHLRLLVAPFILRRMKRDVLDDLPEKVETLMSSEMTAEQRRLYAAYAARLMDEAEGGLAGAQDRMRMLAGLTRLRQLCCDPRLCLEDYAGGSGKLEQCIELVRDSLAGGHRILLFSQFTSMLELLRQALTEQGHHVLLLTGDTPKEERLRLANAFNAGEGDVFLISLKAGGTGLNLTGADVVIHYDPWWNTSAQNQATDRAYRIGQTRGVQVFSLIAADTVEERILKLQQAKTELSDGVLSGEETLFNLDTEVLRGLLKG
ncbi:MAG: SNF2-related protein [Clostridiales bacterium]|nr:SNF2-related protein [Clostridiales bacterium]MDY5513434.1 SNF2-related protein [Candidatus Ventricola sp.]